MTLLDALNAVVDYLASLVVGGLVLFLVASFVVPLILIGKLAARLLGLTK